MEKQKQQTEKTLIIMRGVPGSGKSTKAKKLAGNSGYIYSTDDFFMVKGQYVYDPKMIGQYHQKNQLRTQQSMKQNKELIIIDNTNVKLWEMRPYVQLAQKYGYSVRIQEPQTQWAWNYKQCGKKNSHGVPQDKIKIMIDNFQPYNNNLQEIKNAKDNRRRNGGKK